MNISKERQENLLKKIARVKDFIKEKVNNQELLDSLLEIENEIKNSRYGLIFEEHQEGIEEELETNEITLSEIQELSIDVGGREHLLIEGENLAALTILQRTYSQKIDVICIDPPYNTGNKSLKYEDSDYRDKNDNYSHSKWLSFMAKRLRLAKDLLIPNGVLFVNIDATQTGCFIMLCEQVFGEANVCVLIWPKIDPRFDQNRVEKPVCNVKMAHEYVILCYKDKSKTHFNKMMRQPTYSDLEAKEQPYDMESILHGLGTTSSAKDELRDIFGRREIFSTPKPRKLVKELVRVAAGPNAIILDFFAGSGTTGHAVMDLNKEDGGQRRFILVTNNENNICRDITYERLKRIIKNEDCHESVKYLKIEATPKLRKD